MILVYFGYGTLSVISKLAHCSTTAQCTLLRNLFAERAGFKSTPASYTLSGVGGDAVHHKDGRLWEVALQDKTGAVLTCKAFGVDHILSEDIGHGLLKHLRKRFKHAPASVFLALKERPLDLLLGNSALALQPKCTSGLQCKNCENGICCYESKFGDGWVLIGHDHSQDSAFSNAATIRVHATRISPILEDSFFQGEQLGVAQTPACVKCKQMLQDCRFCSSDRTLCTAQEEAEYSAMKEYCTYDPALGGLSDKYPWVADPAVLQSPTR